MFRPRGLEWSRSDNKGENVWDYWSSRFALLFSFAVSCYRMDLTIEFTLGNHGEDVKELYYYLDSTPTHSYMKFLYKYPQKEYPYEQLVRESSNRGRDVGEYEITDTDVFDDDKYWDIFVEVSSP